MDACDRLRRDLTIEKEVLEEIETDALIRFILGVIGFEWLYDWIKHDEIDWDAIWEALVILDIGYIIWVFIGLLRKHGFKDASKQLLKKIGPWAIGILVIQFSVSLYKLVQVRSEAQSHFEMKVRDLYQDTDCEEKNAVFRNHRIPIPN